MNFLSQVTVDKRERKFADGYAWHRAIWEAFPGGPDAARDFLFRVDDLHRSFRVYVLSATEPTAPPWGQWRTKPISPSFLDHAAYRFQLRANPTMRRKGDARRLGLFGEDLLRAWMERKSGAAGFRLVADSLAVGAPLAVRFHRQGHMGKHLAVDFQGILAVTQREAFKNAFRTGIGSAKGFGFGLLMLAPMEGGASSP